MASELNVVTGAFGFTGRHLAARLLGEGKQVLTLTRHPERLKSSGLAMEAVVPAFDDPTRLAETLSGATTLYNTYWIRFPRHRQTFRQAVENIRILVQAARSARVRRLVHVSVSNPSLESPFPYFRGKAEAEQAIIESGLSYAIVRPTLIFGDEGILINNLAWFLGRFPVFAVPGDGRYRMQPVAVEDVVDLAMDLAASDDNVIVDAAGPVTYEFDELLRALAKVVGSKTRLVHAPPNMALLLSKPMGCLVRDVVITRDEIRALMANLLISNEPPVCKTSFSGWLEQNSDRLGRTYMSDIAKHYPQTHQPSAI